jgi:hypothetical protein
MTDRTRSTRGLYGQFVAEVNDAASLAARSPERQGKAQARSAFWIAFGQVAQGQHGRAGRRRWGNVPASLGRRLWRAALRLTSGW